jgi:hypothetical protein
MKSGKEVKDATNGETGALVIRSSAIKAELHTVSPTYIHHAMKQLKRGDRK